MEKFNLLEVFLNYAKFVREKYTYIIIATLLIGIITGYFTSSIGNALKQINTPLIILMVASIGFTIKFKNLPDALKDWKGFLLGLFFNFILAPFFCWIIAKIFLKSYDEISTGIILIGVVPSAGMALVWAGLLNGDMALAMIINVSTMILAPFLIPLLMSIFAGKFITISALSMLKQLILTVLIPIISGIILREIFEKKIDVKKYLPLMPAISATSAILLMLMAVNTNVSLVIKNLNLLFSLVISTIIIFPLIFASVYFFCTKIFSLAKNISITYSSGMKNLPIAIGIAAANFIKPVMLPVAVAFAFQMLTAVLFYNFLRKKSLL